VWLKQKAAVRGVFMAELVEELIGRSLGGAQPWRG